MNYRGINYYAREPAVERESYIMGEEIIECTVLVRVRRDPAHSKDLVRNLAEYELECQLEQWFDRVLKSKDQPKEYTITGVTVK